MSNDLLSEINSDYFRENFNKYTRKAFEMLPVFNKPCILDIGCGSGVQTIELAKLSNGEIIGIDVDQSLLEKLNNKIEEQGFSDRIKIMNCSMLKIHFPNESFDIIWAEGSIAIIGFFKGLKKWKRLLKPNGFLVVHDGAENISNKVKKIFSYGYKLIVHFLLPEDAWWKEYYAPLENQINKLRIKYKNVSKALRILKKYQDEINMVKKNPKIARSVFYIMQKL